MPVNITEEFVCQLMAQIDFSTKQNSALTATADIMNQTIAELDQTIQKPKEQLNKNSKNSSKSPSSDGLKKSLVKKQSLREPSGKKQGAQKGHDGVHFSASSGPDHTKDHMHSDCIGGPPSCEMPFRVCIKETHHEVDAIVTVNVTANNLIEVRECPLHGGVKTEAFPENRKATVQYGKNLLGSCCI